MRSLKSAGERQFQENQTTALSVIISKKNFNGKI